MAKRPVVDLDQLAALKADGMRDAATQLRSMADTLDQAADESDDADEAAKARRASKRAGKGSGARQVDDGRDAFGRAALFTADRPPAAAKAEPFARDAYGRRRH